MGRDALIIQGDALENFPIEAHLIVTDPPYFFKNMGIGWKASDGRTITSKQRVKNLSSGMAFNPNQAKQACESFEPFAKGMFQSLIEGGYALIFSAPRLAHGFSVACEQAGFSIRDLLVWEHKGGQYKGASLERFGGPPDRVTPQPRPMFESIIVAQKTPTTSLSDCWKINQTGLMARRTLDNQVPTNKIYVPKPNKEERKEGGFHPTQKPVKLLEELIHRFSIEGQKVLDPFTGSGTTGVAAIKQNRKFVGIELDKVFVELAQKRLDKLA